VEENRRRALSKDEFELIDTGVFEQDCYWDLFVRYARAADDDILIQINQTKEVPAAQQTAELNRENSAHAASRSQLNESLVTEQREIQNLRTQLASAATATQLRQTKETS